LAHLPLLRIFSTDSLFCSSTIYIDAIVLVFIYSMHSTLSVGQVL
jgi:hypothetical protein